jgi:hypothetical protein
MNIILFMKHIHIKKDGQIRNPDSGFAIPAHKVEQAKKRHFKNRKI